MQPLRLIRAAPPALLVLLFCGQSTSTLGADLILGSLVDEKSKDVAFKLSADSRDKLTGGLVSLDARNYRIVGESRHGLVGASRVEGTKLAEENRVGEYLVFSSSYSEQTATGDPWVASNKYIGCESPYNSFVALYRVLGQAKITRLGNKPFGELTKGNMQVDDSNVYCFMSTRAQ